MNQQKNKFLNIGAELILTAIVAPLFMGLLFWFAGFVMSTYSIMAEVSNQKSDIQEIKQDVKEVKSFLINKSTKGI